MSYEYNGRPTINIQVPLGYNDFDVTSEQFKYPIAQIIVVLVHLCLFMTRKVVLN